MNYTIASGSDCSRGERATAIGGRRWRIRQNCSNGMVGTATLSRLRRSMWLQPPTPTILAVFRMPPPAAKFYLCYSRAPITHPSIVSQILDQAAA